MIVPPKEEVYLGPSVAVNNPFHVLLAATIVQNKAVAQQGLEAGEAEENRGREEVEDMDLGWMEACCTALDLHAEEPAVQVGRTLPSAAEPQLATYFLYLLCLHLLTLRLSERRRQVGPFITCCCTGPD